MNWKKLDPEDSKLIFVLTISGILIVLFYSVFNNLKPLIDALKTALNILTPFLMGILFAIILLPLRRFIEHRWLKNIKKHQRGLSVTLTMTIVAVAIFLFFVIIIPQIVSSITAFIENVDSYLDTVMKMVSNLQQYNLPFTNDLQLRVKEISTDLLKWMTGAQGGISILLSQTIAFVKNILNFFIGVIIAVYLLLEEELFKTQLKKFLYWIFREKTANDLVYVGRLSYKMFNKFISGKALDSLIVGIVCWIVTMILGMPYAPLIGFIVGVTNMIPVFGPFIGAVPCIFILLIIKPIFALEFMVFIIILQQIDGNILGPSILGDSMGLPTLWIMFAIIVGGSMFGVLGMFLGVPVFAVIYTVISQVIDDNLKERNIDVDKK